MALPTYSTEIVNGELVVTWDGRTQSLPLPSKPYLLGYHSRGDWFIVEVHGDVIDTDSFSGVIHVA